MPDYSFYRDQFLGEIIPETAFPRLMKRAADQLAYWNSLFDIRPRPGIEEAEACALCAVAEAMYEFEQEDEGRGLAKVSIGSVSETYVAPAALCSATLSLREAHFRREAGYYLQFGRWADAM